MQKKSQSYFHDRISKIRKLWQHRHHHDGPPEDRNGQPHSSPLASILPTCVCQAPRLSSFSEEDDADERDVKKIDQSALSDLEWFLTQDFKSLLSGNAEEKQNDFKGAELKNNFSDEFSESSYKHDHGEGINITISGDEEFIEVDEILKNKMLAFGDEKCDALYKSSYDPYDDFRISMVEMVEFRFETGGTIDWEFMEDLLSCYLDMNDTSIHSYIIDASVDVAVAVLQSSGSFPPAPNKDLTAREWARRR